MDIEEIRDEVIKRRNAWGDPSYGQNYLDAINLLKYFPKNRTIVDDYIEQLSKIKKYVDDLFRENRDLYLVNMISFIQSWPSTSLGFDGFGGDSITDAMTTVIMVQNKKDGIISAVVFFAGRFAYMYQTSQNLNIDIQRREMCSVKEAESKYGPPF